MLGKLTYSLLLVGLLLLVVILHMFRQEKITTKFAIIWGAPILLIFLVALIPSFFVKIANFLGFQTISSLMVGILFGILSYIVIVLTVLISDQNKKISVLIQELSILKNEKNKRI